MPVQQNVHTKGSRHLISSTSTHPPPQRSVHFMTSNQWAPPRASPHPMTTAPPPSNSQPPPYRPPAQPRPVISIDTDEDFSDEELEVESTEEGEEDPSLIQVREMPLYAIFTHCKVVHAPSGRCSRPLASQWSPGTQSSSSNSPHSTSTHRTCSSNVRSISFFIFGPIPSHGVFIFHPIPSHGSFIFGPISSHGSFVFYPTGFSTKGHNPHDPRNPGSG